MVETIVQKYGGSSVESIEKMKKIAGRIILTKNQGNSMVVVVSAMGKTTNKLLGFAQEISQNPSKREIDMLISTGEQVSVSLLSMILNEMGHPAVSLTGFQAGIKTEGTHTKNKISDINIEKIIKHLTEGKIVVVAGFQGLNENGDITTLGRGGSDTTAVALAAKLQCSCEIYTDVEGIYSVDPRIHKQAKKLELISYEEMIEMSHLGAKVMEPRSVEIGQRYGVPIYVASSQSNNKGTYIKEIDCEMEHRSVTGLSISENVLMVTLKNVPYTPTNVADIFARLASSEVLVDMISQTSPIDGLVNISFTTPKEDLYAVQGVLYAIGQLFNSIEVQIDDEIIKVSVVGTGMRTQPGIAAKMFQLFAENEIEFKQVTTSEISISYTINGSYKEKAVKAIAQKFDL